MAELPLAAGLLDLRPCKLSSNPPPLPPLSMPARRSPSRSQVTAAIASPRRAVPELHSTTELADGSIVLHFAHPTTEEPEPEAACTGPARVDASTSPQPELGVARAILGDSAPVNEPNPYMAAVAGEISLASSDAGPVEAPEHAISSSGGVEEDTEAGLACGRAVATDESEVDNDGNGVELAVRACGSVEESEAVEAGMTGPTGLEGFEEADASSEGSTSQDFDTDVNTESSGSNGDEQGATEVGVPTPAVNLASLSTTRSASATSPPGAWYPIEVPTICDQPSR